MATKIAFEHDLKCWPQYFKEVKAGNKLFEVRLADRVFREGDCIMLREWNPETGFYTGEQLRLKIGYILREHAGLKPGYVCFQIILQYPHGAF